MPNPNKDKNLDQGVIDSFGHEWATFTYASGQNESELDKQFEAYCAPLDLRIFNSTSSIAADFGAGSGRWTSRLVKYFSKIYALEPSSGANGVLREKFTGNSKIIILEETVGSNSIPNQSLDLAVSLGVLHHIPDTELAIKNIAEKIKPGGHFLCYLYYNLENKPLAYRAAFFMVDNLRKIISSLPQNMKYNICKLIAVTIYWPLSRFSKLLENLGLNTSNIPLHHYSSMPFVMLKNDALDRFGTSLEQRFTKEQISKMLLATTFDLSSLVFSQGEPYWTFSVRKSLG